MAKKLDKKNESVEPNEGGKASIQTKENNFKEMLVIGSWADIKKFFATSV